MGRKTDQFWGYVKKLPNGRFKCTFCESEFCGGASRIKAHLAGLQGQGIAACKLVSEAVQADAMGLITTSKKLKSASTSVNAKEDVHEEVMGLIPTGKKLKIASTSVNAKEDAYEEVMGLNGNVYEEDMGLIPTGKRLKRVSTSINAKEGVEAEVKGWIAPNKKLRSASTSVNAKEHIILSIEMEKNFTENKEELKAEIIVDDIVDRLVGNVISLFTVKIDFENIDFEWEFKEDLKNLLFTFCKIRVVLHDAEERQLRYESLKNWLKELRDVVYDADDVLDTLRYEFSLKVQVHNQKMDKVNFNLCNDVKTIKQSLEKIVSSVAGFGLRVGLVDSITNISLEKNIDSFQDKEEVVGREFDVVKIMNLIISSGNEHVLSVLPIVGMGGLGKTTLAKLVFNHELVKKYFDVRAWVHVGKNFNVEGILREILKSLDEESIGFEDDEIEQILQELQKKMQRKKYILVLDDVWDEANDKWGCFMSLLEGINSNFGNNIIVTTRDDKIAQKIMTLPPHHLEKLSKDDCWYILKKRAYANEGISLPLDLEAIGREIAKRCRGLPLAVRVLGKIMCFKCDKNDWLSIQNNEIWDSLDGDSSDVFPILKLSFDHLPTPSLKRCFAYCAIFPEDCDMRKDELIQYWMAEGFLESPRERSMEMEDIGNMYFSILLETSFFQTARKDAYGNIISCKMHDLVHDLALSIARFETMIVGEDLEDNVSHVQYLYVRFDGKTTRRNSFTGDGFTKLRTLILENADFGNMLPSLKCLRVLKLSGDNIISLPDSFEHLLHLRLLHISHTKIEKLPKSITMLYNLQTLRIKDCSYLKELPKDLSNLINLRHIYLDGVYIERTPKDMGRLTSLQTLQFFTVNLDAGCQVEELEHLNKLKGELDIYNLEHVRDKEEAKRANLVEKTKLYKLGFHWDIGSNREDRYGSDGDVLLAEKYNDEAVLEGLQPHRYLKSLSITGFKGESFPSWMLTGCDARNGLLLFDYLIEISFSLCSKCKQVPPLGHLPCLRVLKIQEMYSVTSIGTQFYGDGNHRTFFPSLRRLELKQMTSLVEWKDAEEMTTESKVFPCLEELTIAECIKLVSAPSHFPSLKKLQISMICSRPFINISSKLTTLRSLNIYDISELYYLPKQLLENNINLKDLKIFGCINLLSISPYRESAFCTSLRSLYIGNCENLMYLPDLLSLEELVVYDCPNLRCLPSIQDVGDLVIDSCGVEDVLSTRLLSCSSLSNLMICDCPNLTSIPDLGELHCLTTLEIINCRQLRCLPQGLSKHLKFLSIGGFRELEAFPSLHSISHLHASLEDLTLIGWAKPSSLPNEIQWFTALRSLEIREFDGMKTLPKWLGNLSSLQKLRIYNCKILMNLIPDLRELHSFNELVIKKCPMLTRLPDGLLGCLTRLKSLGIGGFCEELDVFPIPLSVQHSHVSLERLRLYGWAKLNSLPDEIQHFIALKELHINGFDGMEALPEWLGKLSSLQKLSLWCCEKLMHLPTMNAMRRLTKLERLEIIDCPKLNGENLMYLPTMQAMRCLTKRERLEIIDCPRLNEKFSKGSVAKLSNIVLIPKIQDIYIITKSPLKSILMIVLKLLLLELAFMSIGENVLVQSFLVTFTYRVAS
ncbi:hypothetical protein SO802_022345 [Lithocarpus litseifolius]|uniref:BED-type domain-containing protein n=1 Tax=Lithocarpus litseifolius TaxID=425828 RepID=A0AAW2CHF9_9ROSI